VRHRRPSLEREVALWGEGRRIVVGVDEAGRGPLAGPVVAAAVVFPPGAKPIRGLDDSKVLTPIQRERFAALVRQRALAVAVGAASVPAHVLVDGLPCPELGWPHEALVDGDARCHSIAAASVIAKTVRDRLMRLLAARHPLYAWAENKGYGTPEHLAALDVYGPSFHHRTTFAPVAQLRLFV